MEAWLHKIGSEISIVLLLYGLRVSDICNVDREDIDFEKFFFIFYSTEFLRFIILKFFLFIFIYVFGCEKVSIFTQYGHKKIYNLVSTKNGRTKRKSNSSPRNVILMWDDTQFI